MDLERYRVPASVREGVVIELPGTKDAVFRVALPSEHNRAFSAAQQSALMGKAGMTMGDDGKPDLTQVDFRKFQEARIEAFLQHCILDLPEGLTREALAGEYWPALKALFDRACDLAKDEAASAAAVTKKSPA